MRALLLTAAASVAAIALPATPAQAGDRDGSGFSDNSRSSFDSDFRRDDRRRDRRRDRDSDVFIGEWPQQGDTAWRSNSFNDWWHDQPHRSQPAWLQRNQNCERIWWSGGGWRC